MANAYRDDNDVPCLILSSNVDGKTPVRWLADPVTGRALVDLPSATGTVSSVSVVTANGFAGSVATATTTPAITLSTTITGILKGNGTAISAASDGSDYLSSTTGITVSQSVAQTIGSTGSRLTKLWAIDITVSNPITGSITGNSATVTTNANLTGVITSVGNATSIASQTGTGTKFVVDTSPTLVTPNIGTPSAGVLTNCTGTASGLTSGITNALKSASTTIDVSAATAPSTGQVLTATDSTHATWQTPTTGSTITIVTAATTTLSLTTTAGQKVIVWAKGTMKTPSSQSNTITLAYNGVTKDTFTDVVGNNGGDPEIESYALMYTETPGAATHNITISQSNGGFALSETVIIAMITS